MNLQVDPGLQAQLTQLADRRGCDSESLVIEAIERMVDYDAWLMDQVETGLASIEKGDTHSHEEVGLRLERYLSSRAMKP